MYVAFRILRHVKVDDILHIIDIQTAGCHIGRNQNVQTTLFELFHDPVTLGLAQIAVQSFSNITPAAQRRRQIIYAAFRPAEDNALSFNTGIQKPGDPFYFIPGLKIVLIDQGNRNIPFTYRYHLRRAHIFFCQAQDRTWHGSGEQHSLAFGRNMQQDFFHIFNETHVQHFIRFVQNQIPHMIQLDGTAMNVVQ